jgi:hypothetical protein
MADSYKARCGKQQHAIKAQAQYNSFMRGGWWDNDPAEDAIESQVGRVAHGVPDRISQLRALGNAQVPGVVRKAWELLSDRSRRS